MSARSQRAILVLTMMLAAVCADQLAVAEGNLRPQAVMEALEGVAGRLISQQQKQQPSHVRSLASSPRWDRTPSVLVAEDVCRVHRTEAHPKDLRLPPPAL